MPVKNGRPGQIDFGVLVISQGQAVLLAIGLAVLVVRLALLNVNHAEYTDGILQLTYFHNSSHLWPPIYPLLCQAFSLKVFDLEICGKLISILASVAVLYPIHRMARQLHGETAAAVAVLVYATQPMAWRWSVRVMTDSLFVLFFTMSLAVLVTTLKDVEKQTLFKLRAFVDRRKLEPYILLSSAILLGVLSGLTRYTGILLVPLYFFALLEMTRRPGQKQLRNIGLPLLCSASWLYVFMLLYASSHGGQFSERAGGDSGGFFNTQTLVSYLNVGESFIYLFPYFVTLPVFVFAVWGWVRLANGNLLQKRFAWIAVYLCFSLIALQTLFQSFQSRYLLPLLPLVAVAAGMAFAQWREVRKREGAPGGRFLFYAILVLTLVNAASWSAACLALQRGMWGDVRQAAEYVHSLSLTKNTPVYSNEVYNAGMHLYAIKDGYWTGLDEQVQPIPMRRRYPEGSYLILHSSYGGLDQYFEYRNFLSRNYHVSLKREFRDWAVPLFPDVMEEPDTHQNPGAWFYRYFSQNFRTAVIYIEKPRVKQVEPDE